MVIVIGNTGYIGRQFMEELEKREIETWGLSRSEYDYYDLETLRSILRAKNPELVINCAGYTGKPNVDVCEDNQTETTRANVTLLKVIAKACKMEGVPWGHVSSGCIYTGFEKAWTEKDEPNFSFDVGNCSYYSGTKAEGEKVIKLYGENCYIWRLRIPFDEHDGPRNYLSKMQKYSMLLNVKNSVSHKADFVKYCLELWLSKADYGIYNVTNTGYVTTKQVVDKMNKILALNKDFKYFESEKHMHHLNAVRTPRSSCVLSNLKLRKALKGTGVEVRTATKAVEDALKNWVKEGSNEDSSIDGTFWK